MTTTITVPGTYGYVVLSCAVLPWISFWAMSGQIGNARKKFNVPYPNLYGTPGYHDKADDFNRVQRGHQNMLESLTHFTVMSLLGGLKHPLTSIATGVFYSYGCYAYMQGYSDTSLDVKMARYKKGGALKFIGIFGSLGTCISIAYSMCGGK